MTRPDARSARPGKAAAIWILSSFSKRCGVLTCADWCASGYRRTAALTDSAPNSVSIGLVVGPPGSGKTTLLSHMAAAAGDAAAWYRVGTEDDEEIALTRHVGHTLGAALGRTELIAAAAPGRISDLVCALEIRRSAQRS